MYITYHLALRPTRFMSNFLRVPVTDGKIYEHIPADRAQGWISTNDISAVAAVVLSEDIHKHGDAVYTLVGDVCTPTQRAEIFSRLAGKEITYQQISPAQRYKAFISWGVFGHNVCMDLCGVGEDYDDARVSNEISILLGREPETLEQYIATKKSIFFH